MPGTLLAFLGVAVVVTLTPGPATALVVRSALRGGRRFALETTFGNATGILFWALASAIGLVQTERLEEIVAWKSDVAREELDPIHPGRLQLPDGMTSGFYKYVTFDPIERSTGKVYDQPCHRIMGHHVDLPNSDWVAQNHWCVPLYYAPVSEAPLPA